MTVEQTICIEYFFVEVEFSDIRNLLAMGSVFVVSVLYFEPDNEEARAMMQRISQMLKNSKVIKQETVGHFNFSCH